VVHSLGFVLLAIVAQGDSQAVVRWAQRAQADFESARRARLPSVEAQPASRCDPLLGAELIGRFCYWDDGSASNPPPEPSSIGALRQRLLQVLDSAAAMVPGDEWIAGQRVRYLVEDGRAAAALTAARDCRSTAWWCESLAGFALHAAGESHAADSAFTAALGDMPRDERCRWNDLSTLLADGRLRRGYRKQTCEERGSLEVRLWWLAQPLFSRPGNDRRVEHYARHTMARMLEHARSPFGLATGDDLRELIVRYGWPVAWEQERPRPAEMDRQVVGHDRQPTYHFVPEETGIAAASTLDPERSRELYAPTYAKAFTILEPEIAAFRRGDSTLVVAAYDVSQDTLFRSRPLAAALVLARGETDSMVVERRAAAGPSGVLIAMAPWVARLASLEITDEPRAAGRARVALAARDPDSPVFALSDLLFFKPPDSLPGDLPAVLPYVQAAATVPRGTRLGLYWEVYGLPVGEPVAISVSVQPRQKGLFRRVAESVGLATTSPPLELRWQERMREAGGLAARALEVDVSTLPPGRYRITVFVAPTGREPASATRELHVVASW
jgi:hypothetical protein